MTNEELAQRIYSGQNELLGKLFIQNKGIISKYASSYYNRHQERCSACGVDIEDLFNQSFFALPDAVTSYCTSENNYTFTAYLKYPLLNQFNTISGYRTKSGRQEPLNGYTSLDLPVPGMDSDEDAILLDTIVDKDAEFEERIIESATLHSAMTTIKEALKDYDGYYELLYIHYVLRQTQKEIAADLGYCDKDIASMIRQAMRILRKSVAVRSYCDYIDAGYYMSGLTRFKQTSTSSVEWSVIRMNNK